MRDSIVPPEENKIKNIVPFRRKKDGLCAWFKKIKQLFKLHKELKIMEEYLRKQRTKQQQLEEDKSKFFVIKVCLIII